jgi:hypothetical protein
VIYAAAIALAFVAPILADACYAAVAAWWLIPDRRVEKALPSDCSCRYSVDLRDRQNSRDW